MTISRLLGLVGIAALSGCADPGASYHTAAACIHDQFLTRLNGNNLNGNKLLAPSSTTGSAVFAQAIKTCGEQVPDLTGDTLMQGVAILYHVPFRIDFAADTRMKNSPDNQIMATGSLIPLPAMIFHKT